MSYRFHVSDEMSEQAEQLRVRFMECVQMELLWAEHWQTLSALPVWLDKLSRGEFSDAHQALDAFKGLGAVYNQFEECIDVVGGEVIQKAGHENSLPVAEMRDYMLFYDNHRTDLSWLIQNAQKVIEADEQQEPHERLESMNHPPAQTRRWWRFLGS